MLDYVLAIAWSMAYLGIIAAQILGWKEKKLAIPLIAIVGNFCWEIAAAILEGAWAHWLWLGLDAVILTLALIFTRKWSVRILTLFATVALTGLCMWLFTVENGMLYSVFVIDLFMAICFLVWRKKLSTRLAIPIAACKLLGDICAGIHSGKNDILVAAIVVAVLLCNVMDLFMCIERRKTDVTAV